MSFKKARFFVDSGEGHGCLLGAVDLHLALGRDDLCVVRYRCGRGWPDYQPIENVGFSSDF
jgi:hypothetical protein